MMVDVHRSGGIAKRLNADSERKIREVVTQVSGSEIVIERAGGSFTFEIDVNSEGKEFCIPKKTVKGGNRNMDVGELQVERSYYDALWEGRNAEMARSPCDSTFRTHWASNLLHNQVKMHDAMKFNSAP